MLLKAIQEFFPLMGLSVFYLVLFCFDIDSNIQLGFPICYIVALSISTKSYSRYRALKHLMISILGGAIIYLVCYFIWIPLAWSICSIATSAILDFDDITNQCTHHAIQLSYGFISPILFFLFNMMILNLKRYTIRWLIYLFVMSSLLILYDPDILQNTFYNRKPSSFYSYILWQIILTLLIFIEIYIQRGKTDLVMNK